MSAKKMHQSMQQLDGLHTKAMPLTYEESVLTLQMLAAQNKSLLAENLKLINLLSQAFLHGNNTGNTEYWFSNDMPVPVYKLEAGTLTPVKVNLAAFIHFGYSLEEYKQIPFLQLFPEKDLQRVTGALHFSGEPDPYPLKEIGTRIIKKDKSEAAIILKVARPPADDQGIYILAMPDYVADNTAEKQQNASENVYRALVEKGSEIIGLNDRDGKIIYLSPTVKNVLGTEPDERVGMHVFDVIHPDDLPQVKTVLASLMKNPGSSQRAQWRHKHKSGRWIWMEGIATNLLDDPSVNAIVHNFRDISLQKEAERKMLWEMELTETIINSLPGIFCLLNEEGKLLKWNRNGIEVSGYSIEEIAGMSPLDFFEESDKQLIKDKILEVYLKGSAETEAVMITKTGKKVPYYFTGQLCEFGEERYMITIGMDITERKLALSELDEKNRELRKLSVYLQDVREEERKYIAKEVHEEFGQLASAIKMGIDWIYLQISNADESVKQRLEQTINTVQVLINAVQKLATHMRPSILDDFGLHVALHWLCEEIEKKNKISCIFKQGFNDEGLSFNLRTQLFRIVQETLLNIVKSENATNIQISTREEMGKIYLTIEDNGMRLDAISQQSRFDLVQIRERANAIGGEMKLEINKDLGRTILIIIPKP